MFNKNITLLLLGLLFLLILLLIIYLSSNINKAKIKPTPVPTPVVFSPSPSPSLENELERQTQADINVANLQEEVFKKYPWYLKLPLQEPNYFVYFDASKNTFFASIYPQKSSSISIDDQVKSYQEEILKRLTQLGIDTSLYKIDWEIKPE